MVKVYAIVLLIGVVGLLVVLMGGTFAENLDRPDRNPNRWLGRRGRMTMGGLLGFAMGGMAGEFSPLDLSWQVALVVAIGAGGLGVLWVRYAETTTSR